MINKSDMVRYLAPLYLGIQELTGHNVYAVPRALPAAYAGYGLGLCAHPRNFETCLEEEKQMPDRGVVAIDVSSASLGVDARGMDTPMYVFNEEEAVLDWEAEFPNDEPDHIYCDRVRSDIRRVIKGLVARSRRLPGSKFVDDILIIGAIGEEKELVAMVKELVAEVQEEGAMIWNEQPESVFAKGAAELAKKVLVQRGRVM